MDSINFRPLGPNHLAVDVNNQTIYVRNDLETGTIKARMFGSSAEHLICSSNALQNSLLYGTGQITLRIPRFSK